MNRNGTLASPAIDLASSVLPVPGGPTEDALRDAPADRDEALRLAKKIDDLLHFFLGFVNAGHVGKRDRARLGPGLARLGLEGGNPPRGHPVEQHADDADENQAEQKRAVTVGRRLRRAADVDADIPLREIRHEGRVAGHVVRGHHRAEDRPVCEFEVERVAVDDDLRNGTAVKVPQEVREGNLRDGDRCAAAHHESGAGQQDHADGSNHPRDRVGPFASKHVTLR